MSLGVATVSGQLDGIGKGEMRVNYSIILGSVAALTVAAIVCRVNGQSKITILSKG